MNRQLTSPRTATQTPPIVTMYMPSQFAGLENQYDLCITAADRFPFFDHLTAATYNGKNAQQKHFVLHDFIVQVNPFVLFPTHRTGLHPKLTNQCHRVPVHKHTGHTLYIGTSKERTNEQTNDDDDDDIVLTVYSA